MHVKKVLWGPVVQQARETINKSTSAICKLIAYATLETRRQEDYQIAYLPGASFVNRKVFCGDELVIK